MRKLLLLLFAFIVVACVSCERENLYDDEPYEPMAEDSIHEYIDTPDGVEVTDKMQARKVVESFLDGINVNFSTGEPEANEDSIYATHYHFQVYYKGILYKSHKISLHQMRDFENNCYSTTKVLISGNELFYNDISVDPRLSKEEALKYLKRSDRAIKDEVIKSEPEMLIFKGSGEGDVPQLAYRIRVDISIFDRWDYYVSALTGKVLERWYQGAIS